MWRLDKGASLALVGVALAACRSDLEITGSSGVGGDFGSGGFTGTGANGSGSTPTSSGPGTSGTGGAPSTSVATASGTSGTSSTSASSSATTTVTATSSSVTTSSSSTTSGGPVNEGLTCNDPIPIALGLGSLSVPGTTMGGLNLHTTEPTGGSTCWNTDGPERVYAITAQATGTLTAWLPAATTTFQSALFQTSTCEAAGQSACRDNWGTPNERGGELVSISMVEGETHYLIVDGVLGDQGDFVLELDLSTGADCSDPIPITVEGLGPIYASSPITDFSDNTSCASGENGGPEVVYEVTVTETDDYNFFMTSGYSNLGKIAYARSSCDVAATELDCDHPELTGLQLTAGQTVYVFFDRQLTPSEAGGFTDAHVGGTIIHYY
jgi:hypothetical protein